MNSTQTPSLYYRDALSVIETVWNARSSLLCDFPFHHCPGPQIGSLTRSLHLRGIATSQDRNKRPESFQYLRHWLIIMTRPETSPDSLSQAGRVSIERPNIGSMFPNRDCVLWPGHSPVIPVSKVRVSMSLQYILCHTEDPNLCGNVSSGLLPSIIIHFTALMCSSSSAVLWFIKIWDYIIKDVTQI